MPKPPTKTAARKAAPQKPDACPFKAAINRGDYPEMVNILLVKLDESKDQNIDLLKQIDAKQHTINQFTGLISLAHAMGKL